ncbi:hypothetical protein ACTMTJ_09585 [Phytohabitans sp. LJ34]|uniref:hypothetical protein n=1 Tax=Phytohabitans sp. LJ34 TaxID=3452217 RepID=UPI003F8AF860
MAVLLSAVGVVVQPSPVRADDWYRDGCFNARQEHHVMRWNEYELVVEPGPVIRYGHASLSTTVSYSTSLTETRTATITVEGTLDVGKVIELSLKAGYQTQVSVQRGVTSAVNMVLPPGEFVMVTPYMRYEFRKVITTWVKADGSGSCGISATVARVPTAFGACPIREGRTLAEECGSSLARRGGGAGPNPGGAAPPTPPGPQPVTDVRSVADGTVLATTDTKRIYKVVGGAPVWQATCDNGICEPQSRPTTQAVIDAGPARPRNGSSAIDQRGRVYLFVGGAPLWQDSCAAPVNCGTPVKVSNWSIDARDHMNQVPADGNLVQAVSNGTDLPVAATLGGALIPFANPQEVIETGHGTDWARKVTAISGVSYHTLGFEPANGTLVQGVAGGVSTPVATFAGGAIVPFASPQEVIDTGHGGDWAGKVRAVPARIFNARSRVPTDNTLVQGTGGGASTPVAMMVGGARINVASPQELIDAGYGTDWPSKVQAIPTRVFNELRADVPADGTLIQGINGSTPVAKIVGGATVPFANPQEVTDVGYGAEWHLHVRAVPHRAYTALRSTPANGTLVKKPNHEGIGVVLGGAWVSFSNWNELEETGHKGQPIHVIPSRVLDALPRTIGDGVLVKKADHSGIGVIVGGAWVSFDTWNELAGAGYGSHPVHVIPGRVLDALPRTIGDGVLVKKPDHSGIGVIVGGAWVSFDTWNELAGAGYGSHPVHVIPGRVLDALPRTIGDGVLVKKPDHSGIGVIVGGAWVSFDTWNELAGAGYGSHPVHVIPGRVLDALPRTIGDGVLVKKPDHSGIGVIVGGAWVSFDTWNELAGAGYGNHPVHVIPGRVLDALPRTIGDGVLVKSPDSATVWKIVGGKRTVTTETGSVRTVPKRVIDGIPLA